MYPTLQHAYGLFIIKRYYNNHMKYDWRNIEFNIYIDLSTTNICYRSGERRKKSSMDKPIFLM